MHLTITPHDPMIARDARAFGEGSGARTMDWFNPSVGAGSLRSLLGKLGGGFSPDMVRNLKASSIRGPFPLLGRDIFFRSPLDFVARKDDLQIFPLRPSFLSDGEGTDIPDGILPCFPEGQEEDFKPFRSPLFWSSERISEWLSSPSPSKPFIDNWKTQGEIPAEKGFLHSLPRDVRTHVNIDPAKGSAKEGMLFSTTGLTFLCKTGKGIKPLELAMEVRCVDECLDRIAGSLSSSHPMGSERRIGYWRSDTGCNPLWDCPQVIANALSGSGRIRMMLATPAPFTQGWLPGWLKKREGGIIGTPPGSNVELRLVSAVIGRWQPISGWSIENGKPQGPKALRRMVPAGSVYFFEVQGKITAGLADLWLNSVCDDEQDRRDGFGLSLWGTW